MQSAAYKPRAQLSESVDLVLADSTNYVVVTTTRCVTDAHESPFLLSTDLVSHGVGAKTGFRCRRTDVRCSLYKFAKSRSSEFTRRLADCLPWIFRPGHGNNGSNYLDIDPDHEWDVLFYNDGII